MPDPGLTTDCDYPVAAQPTPREVLKGYLARGKALQDCTDRMRAIRGN